jgi:molybdenum cofactor guanylyltransferase
VSGLRAYILAGGRSTRFGSDKALAIVDGEPQLARLTRIVRQRWGEPTIVARDVEKYASLGCRTIADACDEIGPIGGVRAALRDLERVAGEVGLRPDCHAADGRLEPDGWALILSCDWVDVPADAVQRLLDARQPGDLAVAFRHDRWEPLIALYHARCLDVVERRIGTGKHGLQGVLDEAGARAASWDGSATQFNTAGELLAGLAKGRGNAILGDSQ